MSCMRVYAACDQGWCRILDVENEEEDRRILHAFARTSAEPKGNMSLCLLSLVIWPGQAPLQKLKATE